MVLLKPVAKQIAYIFGFNPGTSPSSPGAISSVTLIEGSPKKSSPIDPTKVDNKTIVAKDNDAAAKILMKDESIELVDQSDEDIKYKEEEQEKNKKEKTDEKYKMSQKFTEVREFII